MLIISKIIPIATEIKYVSDNIFIFSFAFLFTWKSTAIPIPAPDKSPVRSEAKEILPSINSSVISIDEAQFGIRPISATMNGWKTLPLIKIWRSNSLPIKCITVFNIKAKINTNKKTLKVWDKIDLKTFSL